MKKTKLFGWALVATTICSSFSACSNDAEEVLAQESEIRLTSEIMPSRVVDLDLQSTKIIEGRKVGVTIWGAKDSHKNIAWEASADGTLTNTGNAIYYGNEDATITAYHPYNSSWTSTITDPVISTSVYFSVSTDQSVEANYLGSDLLWATATSSKTDKAVPLTFTHKLAKINVTLTSTDIQDLSGATIYICGTKIQRKFQPKTGDLSDINDSYVKNIKAGVTTKDNYTASAIVIPQTIPAGTSFITVVHGDKSYLYKIGSEGKDLKSGYSYNYKLNVKEREVEVELKSANITPWISEENIGNIEEEDLSWFNPNQYITYVANYESLSNSDPNASDYFYHCRSYINCPISSSINKIEFKYQMNNYPESYIGDKNIYLQNNLPYMNDNGITFNSSTNYTWNELGVGITDCMTLYISKKDNCLTLNNVEMEYKLSPNYSLNCDYFFTYYSYDNHEGQYKKWSGVPEGSKLYYVKMWDEDGNLLYLGGASKALNPNTNQMENCWRSYYSGNEKVEFAHYSATLTEYKPYGGGIDEE